MTGGWLPKRFPKRGCIRLRMKFLMYLMKTSGLEGGNVDAVQIMNVDNQPVEEDATQPTPLSTKSLTIQNAAQTENETEQQNT